MKCAEDYQNTQERLAAKLGSDVSGDAEATPTAPPARQELSSAPSAPPMEPTIQPIETFQSSECVVCLEMKVRRQTRSLCKSNLFEESRLDIAYSNSFQIEQMNIATDRS
jgi:hypothetical protein